MSTYTATLTLTRPVTDPDLAAQVQDVDLAAFHASITTDGQGRALVSFDVEAADLAQAVATARALLLPRFSDGARLEVISTAERDQDQTTIPPLASVSEAAERLGISRQSVLRHLSTGKLAGQLVGNTWVVPQASLPH